MLMAEAAGAALARAGAVVVTGGLGGAMEAACRGAKRAGGQTVGILPGVSRGAGNRFLDIALPTGMGEMRNVLVVRVSDGVLGVGGSFGTLSELAMGAKLGKPVVTVRSWEVASEGERWRIPSFDSVEDAVEKLLEIVQPRPTSET